MICFSAVAEKHPNILFIMIDQMRFDAIAALGNTDLYTPNLDRLVQRGAVMTRAYSDCPVSAHTTIVGTCLSIPSLLRDRARRVSVKAEGCV